MKKLTIALAGNPNVGKSTLLAALTGSSVHIANWPGVTVEIYRGKVRYRGYEITIVDLPGIYGLTGVSQEEIIARRYIVSGKADVVIVVADATAPERTLSLALQVLELTNKVVVALNKFDLAHTKGVHINVDKLSSRLGVPVVPVSATKNIGLERLLDAAIKVAQSPPKTAFKVDYGVLERYVSEVENLLKNCPITYPRRWAAVKILEGDGEVVDEVRRVCGEEVVERSILVRERAFRELGQPPEVIAAAMRFKALDKIVGDAIVRKSIEYRLSLVDKIFARSWTGIIAATALMFSILFVAFTINTGFPLNILIEYVLGSEYAEAVEKFSVASLLSDLFSWIASEAYRLVFEATGSDMLADMVANGVIAGVGTVLVFLPMITVFFLLYSVLEDSGLLARIGVALHRLLSVFGLSGRAFFPLFVGLGCNVPAVMLSRASSDSGERLQVIISSPFIMCQARLIVAMGFAMALANSAIMQAAIVLSLYAITTAVALATALFVRRVILRTRESPELLLEIPPLHAPSAKVIAWLTWGYVKHFLKRAGTVILGMSIVLWAVTYFGLYESIGNIIAPAVAALYHLDPESSKVVAVGLLFGLAAKEVFLETLVMLAPASNTVDAIHTIFKTFSQAYAVLVFAATYMPCAATLATIYSETRSVKYTTFALLYSIAVATVISYLVYITLSLAGV